MKIKNREDAARNGDRYFYSGTPCKYGHLGMRYVTSGNCVECVKAKAAIRHKIIREIIKAN